MVENQGKVRESKARACNVRKGVLDPRRMYLGTGRSGAVAYNGELEANIALTFWQCLLRPWARTLDPSPDGCGTIEPRIDRVIIPY